MIVKTLYTGGGVSLSPVYAEGRSESRYVRLVADDGKAVTNGSIITACVDVPTDQVGNWSDCAAQEQDDELSAEEALDILTGGGT